MIAERVLVVCRLLSMEKKLCAFIHFCVAKIEEQRMLET